MNGTSTPLPGVPLRCYLIEVRRVVYSHMAARKSCTHLTWAEAKSKVGGSTTTTTAGGKKKGPSKKVSHDQALLQKVIFKNGGSSQEDQRAAQRKQMKEEQRFAAIAAKRAQERERERAEQSLIKPSEQAEQGLKDAAAQLKTAPIIVHPEASSSSSSMDLSTMKNIAQNIEMQLDELLALEAIFADTDQFLISESCNVEDLRDLIEKWQSDEDNEHLLRSVVRHPPLSFTLQLTVDDDRDNNNDDDTELVAHMLLCITMTPMYPSNGAAVPKFDISYFMLTDKREECSADKPLESLAYVDESKLLEVMIQESKQIIPDPCVYEVASTWLTENIFQYIVMNTYGDLARKE